MKYSSLILTLFAATFAFSFAQVPRDFALRLARVGEDATLSVGTLPGDLPLALSLPEEIEVAGSLTERYEGRTTTTLYLSSEAPEARVRADLAAQLRLAGLRALPQNEPWEWGFVPARGSYDVLEFCRDDLFIRAVLGRADRGVEIEVVLEEVAGRAECDQRLEDAMMRDEHTPPVPVLRSPANVQAFDMDFGGTFMGQYSTVALEAGLDPVTLSEHYAAQLEEAGWARMNSSETASVTWTQWRYEDDRGPWTGFMQILGDEVFPEQTIAYLFVVQM